MTRTCPCGTGTPYDECCGPLHRNTHQAETPERLMRSRYSAYALGELDHVFRTWHPRTRPDDVTPAPGLTWTGLEIVDAHGETVHFRAHFETSEGPGVLEEVSRFEQRGGRWVYVDGDVT